LCRLLKLSLCRTKSCRLAGLYCSSTTTKTTLLLLPIKVVVQTKIQQIWCMDTLTRNMPSKKQYNLVPNDDYDTRIPMHPEEAFEHGITFHAKVRQRFFFFKYHFIILLVAPPAPHLFYIVKQPTLGPIYLRSSYYCNTNVILYIVVITCYLVCLI